MRPVTLLSLLALLTSLPQAQELAGAPNEFVETPGEMEFSGEMLARPLQLANADEYGLTLAEVQAHRDQAHDALVGLEILDYEVRIDEYRFRVAAGSENAVARELMAGGDFEYVSPNWNVWPIACPDDPLLGSQWHHAADRMNSCAGWDIEIGDPSVVIAICDTGVRKNHEDIAANRLEGYNAVDQLWENNGGQVTDINGHGTMTTGCAAAIGDNGVGVSGTGQMFSSRMMRVSNSTGGGSTIAILNHASMTAADAGDRVVNVSYSGVTSAGVDATGAYVRSKGGLLLWAAGNSGKKLVGNRNDNVIIVSATDQNDVLATFSNRGSLVDLSAPGVSILTSTFGSNSSYGSASGTSFASPLTAGLCGLLFAADPTLTPQEAEDLLRAGCDDLGAPGIDPKYGHGRIDVFQTLSLLGGSIGTNYCGPANMNSAGLSATIAADGSDVVSDNDVTLTAASMPANKFGYFLVSSVQDFIQNPGGSQGNLCLGTPIGRYSGQIQNTGATGEFSMPVDLTAIPQPGGNVVAQPGETWNFQAWYRDNNPNPTSNFTDGISILLK